MMMMTEDSNLLQCNALQIGMQVQTFPNSVLPPSLGLFKKVMNGSAYLQLSIFVYFVQVVGFTLSQATKALRESRGISLLYFRPLHQKGVRGQRHAPAAPHPRERPGTHCTGGWVGLRAGLDRCGKSRLTGIRSPDRPAHRQSLYRLRYPTHILCVLECNNKGPLHSCRNILLADI